MPVFPLLPPPHPRFLDPFVQGGLRHPRFQPVCALTPGDFEAVVHGPPCEKTLSVELGAYYLRFLPGLKCHQNADHLG